MQAGKTRQVSDKYNLNITPTLVKHNVIVHVDIWYAQRDPMYLTSIDKLTKYATAYYLEDRNWCQY